MATPAVARDPRFAHAVHCVTNNKGGIGKSIIAWMLAQYLTNPVCLDTDPGNPTFSKFAALNVKRVELIRDGDIHPAMFDLMIERVLVNEGPFVIDIGTSNFVSFWNYVRKTDVFEILAGEGRPVILHVPIAPPPNFDDTVAGFTRICAVAPDKSIVPWLNQREERALQDHGDQFLDLPEIQQSAGKILDVVTLVRQAYRLHREAVGTIIENMWTFREAQEEKDFPFMRKRYLAQVRDELFRELARIGF